ncbi:hypothetical protein [Asaia bogorensis]|uniref:hypothetical protein n=1 Tax=Asaia bogorensis TaxID=91915 RepID=UPI000EFAD561|nr:hypothetical protein [Asaia bogorensis]
MNYVFWVGKSYQFVVIITFFAMIVISKHDSPQTRGIKVITRFLTIQLEFLQQKHELFPGVSIVAFCRGDAGKILILPGKFPQQVRCGAVRKSALLERLLQGEMKDI